MVHRSPVPTFPADRARVDPRIADQVAETLHGAEIVIDIAPLVMCRRRDGYRAGPMHFLLTRDLGYDDVERLVPADPLISRYAAVLRIALTIGIEIDPLHWIEDPLVGIDQRFQRQSVRADGRLAPRLELLAPRLDGPARRVVICEVDGGRPDDLVV